MNESMNQSMNRSMNGHVNVVAEAEQGHEAFMFGRAASAQ